VTSGTDCGGYGIAADGGCPNQQFDPWTKGVGCSGFGIAGNLGCAVPFYHPTTNCAKFGVAANGGLAHFPGIDPKTLVTKSKLKNFKGACTFKTSVDPQNFNLKTLEVTKFEATWDDVEFKLPELGVFSVQAEAIHTAMSDGLETHFNNLISKQVRQKLNAVCGKRKTIVNKKIDFKKCMKRAPTHLRVGGRRLTQADIHEGHLYTVSASGHVEPKVEAELESLEDADEPADAPSSHHMELVNVELVVHGVEYNELDDAQVADLAAATHMATASFVGVAANEVVSLPKRESTSDTTRLSLQIFVASSQKDELIAKLHIAQGKAFEAALEGSIKPLALGAAKKDQVLVATDKIVVGDTTTSFTNVVTQDDSIFT